VKNLKQDIERGIQSYPELKLKKKGENYIVRGEIVLRHPDLGEFDRYEVSIQFPPCYPKCFPKVVEKSKKIPREADRHVNSDKTLCFTVDPKEKLICRRGIDFEFFLDKILVPHLSRETYREMSGRYEDGEYGHGVSGLWEYFEEALNIKGKKLILEELNRIVLDKWPDRNNLCSCESGIKFKKCHLRKWEKVMVLGQQYLETLLKLLNEDFEENGE